MAWIGRIEAAKIQKTGRGKPMPLHAKSLFMVAIAAMAIAASAHAQALKQVATIPIPGTPINQFGVLAIDQTSGLGYLADKDNKAVVVFDTKTDKYVTRIGGFVGMTQERQHLGPERRRGRQGRRRAVGERRRQHHQGRRYQNRRDHGENRRRAARRGPTPWPTIRTPRSSSSPIRTTRRRSSA